MRVRLTLDVGDFERYVVARYFGDKRPRATRRQVARFAMAALRSMALDRTDDMRGRQQGTARRLLKASREGELPYRASRLAAPAERQPSLW